MFNFGFKNLKSLRDRGSILVLFALLLPVMLLFFILAVDIGLLYSERTKLQGIADAAALAGATERYQKPNASVQLPSLSKNDKLNEVTKASGGIIAGRVWEYLLMNNQKLAKAAEGDTKRNCADVTPGEKAIDSENKDIPIGAEAAFQFTNFTANDDHVYSYDVHDSGSTDIMENYASLVSNYSKDNYDGPQIADIPENIDKIAVQCGVPVDNKDRVRVRLRKLVPTIFLQLFYPDYSNGVPVTVVAAAQTRKPISSFRLVGLHGIWLSHTAIPKNDDKSYPFEPAKYLEGNVYSGDNLSVTWGGTGVPHNYAHSGGEGYHPNILTVKGKIFARNFSNGTFMTENGNDLTETTDKDSKYRDYDIFYRLPRIDGDRDAGEYLYMRYNPERRTMEYATESTLDARHSSGDSNNEGWYHVYNFNRIVHFERVKVWNDDLQRYLPFPPHLMRIGIAPERDREDFLAATKSALSLRQTYRMNLNALYKEAIKALGPDRKNTTDTMWRYLKATTKAKTIMGSDYCTIKQSDAGKSIKLLVEIDGVSTKDVHADGYDTKNALAFLHKGNTLQNLNIEQMVVVVKDGASDNEILNSGNDEYNIYHNGHYYNHNSTLRMQTGTLMIEDVRKGIKLGDVYSEANICIAGHKDSGTITFNGILFSEKNLVVPFGAQSHNFTGSCSIFGNRVIMGYSYGNVLADGDKPTATRNYTCQDLIGGLDYPTNVLIRKRHLFSTNVIKHSGNVFIPTQQSDVPMHYVLLGLTDEEYHAEVFEGEADEGFNDDKDPSSLQLKRYTQNYNYHWFNPNMQMVYYPLSDANVEQVRHRYDGNTKNFRTKNLYRFPSGKYGLQKLTKDNQLASLDAEKDKIAPEDYFDIYHFENTNEKIYDLKADNLLEDLRSSQKPITDPTYGLIDASEFKKLRHHWHVAPNSSASDADDHNYDKHIMAFMPYEANGVLNNPKGTLYHYYIKSDYPYLGGLYDIDKDGINEQLFNVPSVAGNAMLQLLGPALSDLSKRNTGGDMTGNIHGRAFTDLLFTPHYLSEDGLPWTHIEQYNKNNNDFSIPLIIMGSNDYKKTSDGYPWYYWIHGVANNSKNNNTIDSGKRANTDVNVNLLDANRTYLNFWKRAAMYDNKPEGLSNPFAYYPPDDGNGPRTKILQMVQGKATDAPEILTNGGNANNLTSVNRAKSEAYVYRFTVDLDMHVAYRLDDYIRFNCTDDQKFSVSDSFGARPFDEATEENGSYGFYTGRSDPTTKPYHTFGVPDDSIYSSIGLVE